MDASAPHRKARIAAMTLVWLGMVSVIVGWTAVFYEVESVLFTGPVLVVVGAATMILSFTAGHLGAFLAGTLHVVTPLGLFLLVVLAQWGPSRAEEPLAIAGGIYTVAALGVTILAWMTRPNTHAAEQCQSCGYLLVGRPGSMYCPECGKGVEDWQVDAIEKASAGTGR